MRTKMTGHLFRIFHSNHLKENRFKAINNFNNKINKFKEIYKACHYKLIIKTKIIIIISTNKINNSHQNY